MARTNGMETYTNEIKKFKDEIIATKAKLGKQMGR